MQLLEAILLGLVQGLTEFLPISSSAHLRIVGEFLPSATDPGATFTAITQIGTEVAVLVYFWKTITRIVSTWWRSLFGRVDRADPDARLGWLIIIGTLPIVILGFTLQSVIRDAFRNLWLTATMLIVFGLLLGAADRWGRRTRELTQLTYRHGIALGFAQALALIPGVSRSGATTTLGLALGYTRPAAAEYAFLLAVPAVFGSGLFELWKSFEEPGGPYGPLDTAVATVVAFGVGLAVIAFLMSYIKKRSFLPFVIYRLVLGGALIVLLATGVLQPL
ncbi:undecaprenyl-diphosphate phosphatase [Microbacterium sp. CFBP9034]|uniref:undecaprenyl-diphosphate phosphatase n=1 Tax=Microbacterium sp. CFBP9034 TaxID=3096540 RepID=UPI002A6AAE1F|nr:undecaprenyl-diphosphate phosphatase [Microbacterium sp. CFBP9034]MDY0910371.1 undecaprenyl-diphosphate phosphatase [Microbacterium sp. CFBP9034]